MHRNSVAVEVVCSSDAEHSKLAISMEKWKMILEKDNAPELSDKEKLKSIELLGGLRKIIKILLDNNLIQPNAEVDSESESEMKSNATKHEEKSLNTIVIEESDINTLSNIFMFHPDPGSSLSSESYTITKDYHQKNIQTIKAQKKKFHISMQSRDDFWHLFLKNTVIANKISEFATSKWIFVIGILLCVITFVFSYAFQSFVLWLMLYILILIIIWTILLATNISMVRFILGGFFLWFKMYHILNIVIFKKMYYIAITEHFSGSSIFLGSIFLLILVSLSLAYCFSDGLEISARIKIAFLSTGVIMMLALYVDMFFRYDNNVGFYVFGVGFVSYRARVLSSTMTLVIFFAKQTFSTIANHKTAGVMRISPNIDWFNVNDTNRSVELNICT